MFLLAVYDIQDEATEIGTMNLTVKCLDALQAVDAEMADAVHDDEEEEEEAEE